MARMKPRSKGSRTRPLARRSVPTSRIRLRRRRRSSSLRRRSGRGSRPTEPGERRVPNIADLQEAPEPRQAPEPAEPIAEAGPSTEERHAIADQPTEMFDVEAQFEDAATEPDAPSDEELVDAELAEPRLAPVDPLAGIEAGVDGEPGAPTELASPVEDEPADEFDEFFSEQRLSDELNQALEAPLPDEPGAPPTEEAVFIDLEDDEDERPRPPPSSPSRTPPPSPRRSRPPSTRLPLPRLPSRPRRRSPTKTRRCPPPPPPAPPSTRTCSRTPRSSSRTRPRTTSSGSSRSRRRISTSTISRGRAAGMSRLPG